MTEDEIIISLRQAYEAYVAECEEENLEPHTFNMWTVHGMPEGPLG